MYETTSPTDIVSITLSSNVKAAMEKGTKCEKYVLFVFGGDVVPVVDKIFNFQTVASLVPDSKP